MPKGKSSLLNKPRLVILFTVLILLIIAVIYVLKTSSTSPTSYELSSSPTASPTNIFNKLKKAFHKSKPTPSPTATPIPLTQGIGKYTISQGKHTGPTIAKVSFDPLDVKVKQKLTITVSILTNTPADNLTATLQTDGSTDKLTFTKISSDSDYEIWQATTKLSHPVLYKYILTLTAKSNQGTSQAIVAPRS